MVVQKRTPQALVWILLGILFLSRLSQGQQYEGRATVSGLEPVDSAEIAYFNIVGPSGNTTLVNYFSFPNNSRPHPTSFQRLVVILTGHGRDAWNYFGHVRNAIPNAAAILPEVSEESVAILAPWWANTADLPDGSDDTLVWQGTGWSGGYNNVFPENQNNISSFEVIDQILLHFDNKVIYPNIKHIVVASHSRGSEMNHRYAAVGKNLSLKSGLSYWIANTDTFVWFNSTRPLPTESCPIYNEWEEGLEGYTNQYENAFINQGGPAAVHERYNSRDVGLARALRDFGDGAEDCKPESQGENRGERFLNYIESFPPTSNGTVDYVPDTGHSASRMMKDTGGSYRLFIDNWDGEGHRHADIGPRQVAGDNPHPEDT